MKAYTIEISNEEAETLEKISQVLGVGEKTLLEIEIHGWLQKPAEVPLEKIKEKLWEIFCLVVGNVRFL